MNPEEQPAAQLTAPPMAPSAGLPLQSPANETLVKLEASLTDLHESSDDWSGIAKAHRENLRKKIPPEWHLSSELTKDITEKSTTSVLNVPRDCGILTSRELEITEGSVDATQLLARLRRREFSSKEVTIAFCKRAAIAQQLTHCLTETMFDSAIAHAEELDAYFEREGRPIGPLHGLPVSVKDMLPQKGLVCTIGYISFLKHPPISKSALVVEQLLALGAVIYVRTNIPQTMMTADSHNNLYGRVLNPNNLCLTAGGSSGGEGALIRMRGSLLGLGTDIAGSVRIPALSDGIYSLKPTPYRLSLQGSVLPGRLGSPGFPGVVGPMAGSIRDLSLAMRMLLSETSAPWDNDPCAVAVPWRADVENASAEQVQPLTIGLILEHPAAPLHPVGSRCFAAALDALKQAGHKVADLTPMVSAAHKEQSPHLDFDSMIEPIFKIFSLDPQATPVKNIHASGEPVVPSILVVRPSNISDYKPTLDDVWNLNEWVAEVEAAWLEVFRMHKLDVILLPVYQSGAPRHDTWGLPYYTVLANLLKAPAAAIPFGRTDRALDKDFIRTDVEYKPPYDPENSEGAPFGLQIIGRYMQDEKLLGMATRLVEDLKLANV